MEVKSLHEDEICESNEMTTTFRARYIMFKQEMTTGQFSQK